MKFSSIDIVLKVVCNNTQNTIDLHRIGLAPADSFDVWDVLVHIIMKKHK